MQEEILIKKYRTGTTVTYFNNKITEENYNTFSMPAILYFNNIGTAVKMVISDEFATDTSTTLSDGIEVWTISGNDNINRLQDNIPGGYLISGRTFTNTLNYTNVNETKIENAFLNLMQEQFSGTSESFVFFNKTEIEDLDITIKLERHYDVLNTLNTYNKVYDEFPKRESETGVVFGKIVAKQIVKDEDGNRILIPLKGVPVGIFNPTDRFPATSSVSNEGERIRMYFKDDNSSSLWPEKERYENSYSFNADEDAMLEKTQYLYNGNEKGTYSLDFPQEFKYTTTTDEKGEFIIQDVPIGAQTLMFEVDLLQQGLSKEEVALNIFPYKENESLNVDEIPHYFFRQIPIDVVPSWGHKQSGYTETNITANLDLRKWITYYFPPVASKLAEKSHVFMDDPAETYLHERDQGFKIADKTWYSSADNADHSRNRDMFFKLGDPYYRGSVLAPLNIEVRDMTKLFETDDIENSMRKIQMVIVEDTSSRNDINMQIWNNEFSQIKNKAVFNTFGYHAIKLPANLYDITEYRTKSDGTPIESDFHKGVWLGSYEFNLYHNKKIDSYRTTGYRHAWSTSYSGNSRDHFYLNFKKDITEHNGISSAIGNDKGKFPYEQNWTINYPNEYRIPKKPTAARSLFYTSYVDVNDPSFSDGELIGSEAGMGDGTTIVAGYDGFGLSAFKLDIDLVINGVLGAVDDEAYRYNSFLSSVFTGQLYLYENGSWSEYGRYANGYLPGPDNHSSVVNGERYQRVEAGHAYYLHPTGMPLVATSGNGISYQTKVCCNAAGKGNMKRIWQGHYQEEGEYYRHNHYCTSVIFNNGLFTALSLFDSRSDINRQYTDNRGALTLYRLLAEESQDGELNDPFEIFSEIQTSLIKMPYAELHVGYIRTQRGRVRNQRTRFKYSDKEKAMYHIGTANDYSPGYFGNATIKITNNGNIVSKVKVDSVSKDINPGGSKHFDLPISNGITITLPANKDKSMIGVFQVFKKQDYTISFEGVQIPNDWDDQDGWANPDGLSNDYKIRLNKTVSANANESVLDKSFYIIQKMSNIKTVYTDTCSSGWLGGHQPNDIAYNGMLFIRSPRTKQGSIQITQSPYTSFTCGSGDAESFVKL